MCFYSFLADVRSFVVYDSLFCCVCVEHPPTRSHAPTARDAAHQDRPCIMTPIPTQAATGAPTTHNPNDTIITSARTVVGPHTRVRCGCTEVRHWRARGAHQCIAALARAVRPQAHNGAVNGGTGGTECSPLPLPIQGINCISCIAIAA